MSTADRKTEAAAEESDNEVETKSSDEALAKETPVSVEDIQSLPRRERRRKRNTGGTDGEKNKQAKWGPRELNWEYLDHTADIQIHSWGKDLSEAFELAVMGMFGYMTELDTVEIDILTEVKIEAKGHDMPSLLFAFMDEFLYNFCTEDIICKDVRILEFDQQNFRITAIGFGEKFDLNKHPQGTEIKAITYSNMQIYSDFVPRESQGVSHPGDKFPAHVYVIVDI